ncbi:MAG: hypothetical protein ACJ76F_02650 [Bacteroidia bacterium]
MKKLFLTSLFAIGLSTAFAQSPQAFKYQAIARDAAGLELAATPLTVRATIHDGSAGGTVVYQETQAITTNAFGLFSINLGQGTPTIGTFSTIAWNAGTKFLQQEIDFGTGYQDMGTSPLLSVPYALHAANGMAAGTAIGNTPYWDGTQWVNNSNALYNDGTNVGIGTVTPGHKLEVQGNSYASGGFETPAQYTFSTPKTHYLSVSATAFNTIGDGVSFERALDLTGASVSTLGGNSANFALLFAPLNLPDGATITKITAYMADNDAVNSAVINLTGIDNTGNVTLNVVTPSSSGSAITAYASTPFAHVVNNSAKSYNLRFQTYENNQSLLLYNVIIEYTVNQAD